MIHKCHCGAAIPLGRPTCLRCARDAMARFNDKQERINRERRAYKALKQGQTVLTLED